MACCRSARGSFLCSNRLPHGSSSRYDTGIDHEVDVQIKRQRRVRNAFGKPLAIPGLREQGETRRRDRPHVGWIVHEIIVARMGDVNLDLRVVAANPIQLLDDAEISLSLSAEVLEHMMHAIRRPNHWATARVTAQDPPPDRGRRSEICRR